VQPGDTIWLRAGTYRGTFTSQLTGTAAAPIILRQYPGERATIDGTVTIMGAYTWYWGFEVMNSAPLSGSGLGIASYGDYIKLINLVVHDAPQSGIGFWSNGAGGEIYGTILYNNGRHYNLDHGIYTQNANGTKRLLDNVIFNNMAYGIHVYASSGSLKGYDIEGNTVFNNGGSNILVGGSTSAQGITVRDNMTLLGSWSTGVRLGYGAQNQDIVLTGNYFIGGWPALQFQTWSQATVSGNTFYATGPVVDFQSSTSNVTWGNNLHHRDPTAQAWLNNNQSYTLTGWEQVTGLGATDQAGVTQPTGVKTFVRPNAYEPGRGFVTIYNWDQLGSVAVDVSSVLAVGARYEVRNVQALLGGPVLSGTYGGGTLTLPMAAVPSPLPIGSGLVTPPSTGPAFQVFLITTIPS